MEKKDRYHGDSSKVVEKVDVLLTVVHESKRLTRWSSTRNAKERLAAALYWSCQGIGDTDRHQHRSQHQPSHHIARKPGGLGTRSESAVPVPAAYGFQRFMVSGSCSTSWSFEIVVLVRASGC